MRKIAIWIVVSGCALALLSLGGPQAQRLINPGDDSTGSETVPVSVSNFPSTQPVTGTVAVGNFPLTVNVRGTVDVGNLPATQNVTGSVAVNNLPVDADGNVRVAGGVTLMQPEASHFIGITQATVAPITFEFVGPVYGVLAMNRACQGEFSRSRVCLQTELAASIPAPPPWSGFVLTASVSDSLSFDIFEGGGRCVLPEGIFTGACSGPQPVACCGV